MITMSKSVNDNVYTSVLVYQFINIRENPARFPQHRSGPSRRGNNRSHQSASPRDGPKRSVGLDNESRGQRTLQRDTCLSKSTAPLGMYKHNVLL
jgi:hypothetical protein